jgi:hypothetical protein
LAAAPNLFTTPVSVFGLPYVLRLTMRSSGVMYGVGLGLGELATIPGAITAGALALATAAFRRVDSMEAV